MSGVVEDEIRTMTSCDSLTFVISDAMTLRKCRGISLSSGDICAWYPNKNTGLKEFGKRYGHTI
jgi:hypothetical protein